MPEEMVKFVVIVPAEYEERLSNVFMELGLVHLNPQITEISLPALLLAEKRLEELEELRKKFQEFRESIKKAENLLKDLIAIKIAEEVLKNYNLDILEELGLPKKSITSLKEMLEEYDKLKETSPSEELKTLIDEIKRINLTKEIIELVKSNFREEKVFTISRIENALEVWKTLKDLEEDRIILDKELFKKADIKALKEVVNEGEEALRSLDNLIFNIEKVIKGEAERRIVLKYKQVINGLKNYIERITKILPYEPLIELLPRVRSRIREFNVHRIRVSVAEGWIPSKYVKEFKELLKNTVPKVLYIRIRKAMHGEPVPRLVQLKGFRGQLAKLTLMRGVPDYWEIDPTPLFTILFTIMYGMMFGDIGLGVIIVLFGLIIRRAKEGFLGMSEAGIKALSTLSLLCGTSAIIFGALYGVSFLVEIWKPIFLSPLHNLGEIMGVALLFGALQLVLSIVLNIVNKLRLGEKFEAIFGARGLTGLIFYIGGVYLAYNIALSGFDLSVVLNVNLLPITLIVVGAMILTPTTFIIKGTVTKHSELLMHGITEALELITEYPANSLSYIRLAAFALAHEAFGILVESLIDFLGFIPSMIFSNALVLMIEGFAVGIQALRLTYYEFSTKFFKGDGILFEPVITQETQEM